MFMKFIGTTDENPLWINTDKIISISNVYEDGDFKGKAPAKPVQSALQLQGDEMAEFSVIVKGTPELIADIINNKLSNPIEVLITP